MNKYAIAVHGGAGTILKSSLNAEKEAAYKSALADALSAGEQLLQNGGSSLEAVESAIKSLEDNPLFNAGKGAVFTHEGTNELDASIMDGKLLRAGAVAGVKHIKNPITLAKNVMLYSDHVFLAGEGAMNFAKSQKMEHMPDDYFFVQQRYDQWLEAKANDTIQLDHSINKSEKKFGTVGAVAIDKYGNLAAGTSTGGMTNKKNGRVGDTPIIGAGTYANNLTCAISCTGHGEFFIRAVVAYDISCLMEYQGLSLKEACHKVVKDKLVKLGGEGGLIAIDNKGNIELPYNSDGMYRGYLIEGQTPFTAIYAD